MGEFAVDLLHSMAAVAGGKIYNYAGYNTVPSWRTSLNAQGPTVESLFEKAGIDLAAMAGNTLISFVASDGYTVKFTKDQLLAARYYYPNGSVDTANGMLGGDAAQADKVLVPAIINLTVNDGTLSIGQSLPNEQTWDAFNQMMASGGKIIIGDAAPAWNPVTVAGIRTNGVVNGIASDSTVEVGATIDFTRPNGSSNKYAKIYYTLDGSIPTAGSTFYNFNEYGGAAGLTNNILLDQTGEVTIKTIVVGRGGQDSSVTTFTYHVVPEKTVGLTAKVIAPTSTQLTWDAVDGATGYNVYRGLKADTVTELVAKDLTDTSYLDTNLSTNTQYYYQVVATCDGYEGAKSATVSALTLLPEPLIAVASIGYDSINISWAPVNGAFGYNVYRYNDITTEYDLVKTTWAKSFTDSGLTCGKTYTYKVKAFNIDGAVVVFGEASLTKSATPIPAATTSFKAASNGYNSIKLTWSAVPGATGYNVYRYNSTTKQYSYIGGTTGTTLTNTSSTLISGRTYQYKVRAYRLVGAVKVSGAYSIIKSAAPVPSAPKISLTKTSRTSVKIGWTGVAGASYYEIYRKTGTSGTWYLIGKSNYSTSRAWTNINITPGKTYYYKVRACRMVGTQSVKGAFSLVAGKTM